MGCGSIPRFAPVRRSLPMRRALRRWLRKPVIGKPVASFCGRALADRMRIEYHRTLIADRVRNAAFHEALKSVITPGKTDCRRYRRGHRATRRHGGQSSALRTCSPTRRRKWPVSRPRRSEATAPRLAISCRAIRRRWMIPRRGRSRVRNARQLRARREHIDTAGGRAARHLNKGGVVIPNRITQLRRLSSPTVSIAS